MGENRDAMELPQSTSSNFGGDMKFATKTQKSADGQAALALVAALIRGLVASGKLTDTEFHQIIADAQKLAPRQPNVGDQEAQEMIVSILSDR